MPHPKPFLKWVGGKQRLLRRLERRVPVFFKNYHEPMLGGASLFFELSKRQLIRKAFLSDVNLRLVRTYLAIRDDVEGVISTLSSYPHSKDFFLELRATSPESLSDVETAAWFLYLNRTGFNGLYRVNKKNGFNVPFGKYKNPTICNGPLLRVCSEALQRAEIFHSPFEGVLERVSDGDFVYFDPPYVPLNPTSNFTSYTPAGFGYQNQVEVRDLSWSLREEKKVFVLLSNSWTEIVQELYQEFHLEQIEVRRVVSATAKGRGPVFEALIW